MQDLLGLAHDKDIILSQDSPMGDDQDAVLADLIPDTDAEKPADVATRRLLGLRCSKSLTALMTARGKWCGCGSDWTVTDR